MRAAADGEEEELYARGRTAVWARGGASHAADKVVVCSYSTESPIRHALWCTFHCTMPSLTEDIKAETKAASTAASMLANASAAGGAVAQQGAGGVPPPPPLPRPPPPPLPSEQAAAEEASESAESLMPCICIVDNETIKAFTYDGENYIAALQFQVCAIWPCRYGLLLERGASSSPPSSPTAIPGFTSFNSSTGTDCSIMGAGSLPTVFSLSHPLDEMVPIVAKQGMSTFVMNDPCKKIVFTSEKPSILMLYDSNIGLHSVWKIRKATLDERQAVLYNSCMSSVLNNSSLGTTVNSAVGSNVGSPTSATGGRVSLARGALGRFSEGPISRLSGSPFGASRNNSVGSSSHTSGVHSAFQSARESWTHSLRSTLGSLSTLNQPPSHSAAMHHSIAMSTRGPSWGGDGDGGAHASGLGLPDSRLMTSQVVDMNQKARPLLASLCLEFLWTENTINSIEGSAAAASKVFLTTDLVGNAFLCYLVPTLGQLSLIRLKNSNNEKQLMFGAVSTLPAKDAASLPLLNMIAVVEPLGGVVLYSGLSFVGKVHVAGIPSALATSSYLAGFTSPFLKRSSLITSSRPTSGLDSLLFDDELHQLSPVPPAVSTPQPGVVLPGHLPLTATPCSSAVNARPSNAMPKLRLRLDSESGDAKSSGGVHKGQLVALRDAVDKRVTLELNDGSMFRISLPDLCSSALVLESLGVLQRVLPKDLAMQLLVRWYAARNAPGTQDISPSQEWHLFIRLLFELCGYEVEKLVLTRGTSENDLSNLADGTSTPQGKTLGSVPVSVGVGVGVKIGGAAAKKKRTSDAGSEDDWEYLLRSDLYAAVGPGLANMLGLKRAPPPLTRGVSTAVPAGRINPDAPLVASLPLIMFSLHLLYEELKLNALLSESMPMLATLLHQVAGDLQLNAYCQHYWRDFPAQCTPLMHQTSQLSTEDVRRLPSFQMISSEPPDLCEHIFWLIRGLQPTPFPYIANVNPRTKDIVQLAALVTHGAQMPRIQLESFVRQLLPPGTCVEAPALSIRDSAPSASYPFPQRAVLLMTEMGITRRVLQTLPAGISLLLSNVLHQCRQSPPTDWPRAAYELILRQDLAALSSHATMVSCTSASSATPTPVSGNGMAGGGTTAPAGLPTGSNPSSAAAGSGAAVAVAAAGAATATGKSVAAAAAARAPDSEEEDGMETVDSEVLRLRFSQDHRVAEVRRLLQSSQPVRIDIAQRPEVSDHEFIEEQERHLYAICTRTMALPVGRGMFTLRTAVPVVTETLPIPRLCLTGRAPPRGTTVDLSHIEVVPNMNMWPLFHNGVAAGLRIVPHAPDIESAWIVYNKPKGTAEVSTEHAGFLMALGLNGHLNNLARWNAYEYLAKCHEMTSVGLLLGVAANKRGTMDITTTKMLSLHLEALLPPTSIELDIQQNVQVAALLSVGLVYQGTAHRRMAEVLLSEIGRPPGPEMENSVDRESYSLAAGLALGLVVLGRASHLSGLGDLQIPDTLHYYMVGGHKRPFTGSQKEKYKSPSYQIREGDQVNIDVTSPGATLALGMMFFNSGNRAVADWMLAPSTQYLLDFVRPDFLLLRIIARALILWDEVRPTSSWVESNVPISIRPYCLVKPQPANSDCVDYETMNQAYCNILAGACMAVGLRYAGSSNHEAFTTLMKYARMFTSLTGKSIAELAGKSTIETCLNVILLSVAMVMAGSGDLHVLRLCRHLRARCGPAGAGSVVTYGSYLATHMALGLLFLGGGRCTLSSSPPAVAAMLCAFFPKFPTHSNDNRYHLQAFRHLYVVAAEARLLLPRDIDTRRLCYAHLRLVLLQPGARRPSQLRLRAPALLPERSRLLKVIVEDDRYWTIEFNRNSNWAQLENVLQSTGCVDVKQRAGCLSYLEDPQGFRTMLAETLTLDPAISWSVKADSINAFSSDPSVVNFAKHFLERLEGGSGEEASLEEKEQIQTLTRLVYECMTQDKLVILPIWITLQKAIRNLTKDPCPFLVWQLKLVTAQILHSESNNKSSANKSQLPLISPELTLALHLRIFNIMQSWEAELLPYLKMYVRGQYPSDVQILKKLTSYIIYYDIPPPHVLQPLLGKPLNPLSLRSLLASHQPTVGTLNKLLPLFV